jgi:hypothetical protein
MKTSEQINELAKALCKAQSEMTGAEKNSKNPHYKSTYSDLESIINAVSEPFSNNGLCFVQGAEFDENRVAVVTRIIHLSGQWIESTTILPPTKNDVQGYGSAITYGKRYGLQSLAGLASIDDDGQAAVKHKAKPIELDNSVVSKFERCESEDDLSAVWFSLDKSQHPLYNAIKNQAKDRLAA